MQMTEFTAEQEHEILQMIEQAKAREQYVIAGDQFFREALLAVSLKVNQQIYDPYVLEVGKHIYKSFKEANLPQVNQNEARQD
jgi:hypothetical protein